MIKIVDPCTEPVELRAAVATQAVSWDYAHALEITIKSFLYAPAEASCTVEYSCEATESPLAFDGDLCANGKFDPVKGVLFVGSSNTMLNEFTYPAGDYQVLVTGTLGSKSDTTLISLHIKDVQD